MSYNHHNNYIMKCHVLFTFTVAFTARMKPFTGVIVGTGSHDPWVFDVVDTNVGNAYDIRGVFTAPVAGVYVFNFNFISHWDERTMHAKLVKNGETIAVGIANSKGFYDNGGAMVTVQLEKGDEVYVTRGDLGNRILGDWWCKFSGFRLSDGAGT